jgi:hypothetical protein
MEELHQHGGVPQRWKFSVPDGDPKAGRDVFVTLECYQCHEIQGETFPSGSASRPRTGPALTGMGAHHPAEYFAESILNPNAIVVTGPGYTDAAGRSIGPANMRVMTAAAERFSKAQEVSFMWTPRQPAAPEERHLPEGHGAHGTSKGH